MAVRSRVESGKGQWSFTAVIMTSLCWNIGSLHHYYTDSLKQHISVQLAHMLQSDLICSSCLNRVHQSHSTFCWRGKSRPPSQTYAQGSGLSRSETRTGKNYKHVWARSGQNYGLNQIKTNLGPGLDHIRTGSGSGLKGCSYYPSVVQIWFSSQQC